MPDIRPLDGINKDDTQEAVLTVLRAILAKLPVPDAATELARVSGTIQVGNSVNVTTVATVTNQGQMGTLPLNTAVYDFMRMASASLYDQLVVT